MGYSDSSEQILFTGWRGVAVGLFGALACLLALSLAFDQTRLAGLSGMSGKGRLGLESEAIPGRNGWARIALIEPDSAAARAGLSPWMEIRFDRAYEANADLAIGRKVGLTVATDGAGHTTKPRHVLLEAAPDGRRTAGQSDTYLSYTIVFAAWLSVALGALALLRGWGSPGALAFGLGILSYVITPAPPSWATEPWMAESFLWISAVFRSCIIALLVLPAVVYAEHIARPTPGWIRAFAGLAITAAALELFISWCIRTDASYPVIGDGDVALFALSSLCTLVGLYWARRGWRDAAGADRRRFLALFATLLVMTLIDVIEIVITITDVWNGSILSRLVPMVLSNIVVPVLLAYTVLRHRVVDLSFAFNRTVVYATFSAILLGSFGLIEWGVEHLLPEEWIKASAWIDAGVAVLVYLAFHRVHDAVEHRVEQIFFRQWQANEDELRRFVGSAAHFEDARALARAFADELSRFGGDARVALYRRNEGVLDRVGGNWDGTPRHFREDDPAFALMRAERRPLDLGERPTNLPGALALPMLDHGVLSGLVLMDVKGNGALYRPDEVAVLGWAARAVGMALAALHAGLVETENRLLKAQLARLSGIIGDRLERSGA